MTSQALLFLLGCIALAILFIITLIVGIRERGKLRARLFAADRRTADALSSAAAWRDEAMQLRRQNKPARDGSDGVVSGAMRKFKAAAAPARTSSTSRTKTSDPVIDTATGTTFGAWSGNYGSPDTSSPSPAPACDTSSPSADSGACGGGE